MYKRKRVINGGIFLGKNDKNHINKKIDLNKGLYGVVKENLIVEGLKNIKVDSELLNERETEDKSFITRIFRKINANIYNCSCDGKGLKLYLIIAIMNVNV